ncbi:MAG: ClbS/DfsB family four-helix bundle protein [Prevotellaceae bacterium]|nr:ClbS/DfsB family four-helix bundle protein [Prevotellaceae bacterium]
MARPANKQQLISAAADNYDKLTAFIASMNEEELNTPFDFSADEKKKEAHWRRDKNLRDVIMHLVRWQELLQIWVANNMKGLTVQFLLPGYTWKTYGDMNILFWKECQNIPTDDAMKRLSDSHRQIMNLAERFTDKELFGKAHYNWTGTTSLGSYFISTTSAHYDWALKKLKAHRKNMKSIK